MTNDADRRIAPFETDIVENRGYRYTTNAGLSSVLANRRLTDAALSVVNIRGKRVLDIGCGDGTYTISLFDEGEPAEMHGIDPVQEAIAVACQNRGRRDITFSVASASMIPYTADSFDIAHLRGVLHHMDHPDEGIREALRVAHRILVIEPNGYNPALKILERVSRYHRHHGERSFRPSLLDAWVEGSHGDVEQQTYAGLVPFFCPDPVARVLKTLEPIVEALPVVRSLACAVYVFTATRPA